MQKKPLYSIGHGNRKSEEFLALLKKFDIQYLVDVRSVPYSRFNPQFKKNELKSYLQEHRIHYVFMGNALGGKPKDASCYQQTGKVDYEMIKKRDFFLAGIERLKMAHQKDIRLAIMCSESKPEQCHRSKLIGKALLKDGIIVQHIDEKGELKDQSAVIGSLDLF